MEISRASTAHPAGLRALQNVPALGSSRSREVAN